MSSVSTLPAWTWVSTSPASASGPRGRAPRRRSASGRPARATAAIFPSRPPSAPPVTTRSSSTRSPCDQVVGQVSAPLRRPAALAGHSPTVARRAPRARSPRICATVSPTGVEVGGHAARGPAAEVGQPRRVGLQQQRAVRHRPHRVVPVLGTVRVRHARPDREAEAQRGVVAPRPPRVPSWNWISRRGLHPLLAQDPGDRRVRAAAVQDHGQLEPPREPQLVAEHLLLDRAQLRVLVRELQPEVVHVVEPDLADRHHVPLRRAP